MPDINVSQDEAISWYQKPLLDEETRCSLKKTSGSFEKLKELKAKDNKLIIVTARPEELL